MKKWVSFVLAMGLMLLCASAMAELKPVMSFEAYDVDLDQISGVFSIREKDSKYYKLMNSAGDILVPTSEGYRTMSRRYAEDTAVFKVEVTARDGVHDEGLLDSTGRVLVPAEYADVEIVNDSWQIGIKLVSSSSDDKDYTFTNYDTDEKTYYRISQADFYYQGQLAGSLDRSGYGGNYSTAYGAYIMVINREGKRIFYDSGMTPSPYKSEYYQEYDSVYENQKTKMIHQGSGQEAFVPSCTLTTEDVNRAYNYDHGVVYDLQGREVFKTPQAYDFITGDWKYGYAVTRMKSKEGLIDLSGNELIPPIYDDLEDYYMDAFARFGYIPAVKDEKFGILDAQGNVTCAFKYASNIVRSHTTFAEIKDLDGSIIVLSAAMGELPEHYKEVSFGSRPGLAFVGTNQDDQKTVVDIYGNTLLPYTDAYSYIDTSCDATVIVAHKSSKCDIFVLPSPQGGDTMPVISSGDSGNDATVPADGEETWTCENGHAGNTGKFCSECGAPKPTEDDGTWTCENGHGGNTGKFCTECGAPKPEN